MPDMVDPMEPPDVVIADTRVIVGADTRVIVGADGTVVGIGADGTVVGIGSAPPVLNLLDLPQVWVDGHELPRVRSVDIEMSFGHPLPRYVVTATSPYIDYTIRTTRLTLKPKEKS